MNPEPHAHLRRICECGRTLYQCSCTSPKRVVIVKPCRCNHVFRCPRCGAEWKYGEPDSLWCYKPAGAAPGNIKSVRGLEGLDPEQEYAWHVHFNKPVEGKEVASSGTLVRAVPVDPETPSDGTAETGD